MTGPYANIVEDPYEHPEWITLTSTSPAGDGLRVVEYEVNTGAIRVAGPTIVGEQHIHPAP